MVVQLRLTGVKLLLTEFVCFFRRKLRKKNSLRGYRLMDLFYLLCTCLPYSSISRVHVSVDLKGRTIHLEIIFMNENRAKNVHS